MTTLSTYQNALYTIKKLKEELYKQKELQPVAIVGISCRLPQAMDKNEFWELLRNGQNVITKLPEERWQLLEGTQEYSLRRTNHPYWGGYLSNIALFDAYFFGITPREALCMEPQQRLLLEVAYEAFEDAGIPIASLSGSATGAYVALYGSKYIAQFSQQIGVESNALHLVAGNATSIAANRLSYCFDLCGPSLSVDTACSSSLTALHLGWLHLQTKQCDLALVAGISLNLAPSLNYMLAQAQMLSPDGQCKTFDKSANGYVQGEGVGAVILKPLGKALQDKDRIYGVIAEVAVNQDGRTNGLTAPNGARQEALLRMAYKKSNIDPTHIGYIEAHGTGTFLGDPIEVEALGYIIGNQRTADHPCWLGSVKTNVGHLEPAAGIMGLIKVALALEKGKIPPHLNFQDPNPHIPFDRYRFCIPQKIEEWPIYGDYRVAGISGFGFGGTNGHVVMRGLTQLEQKITYHSQPQSWELFTVSAKNPNALKQLILDWISHLDIHEEITLDVWCYHSHLKRSHYPHRLAIIACDVADLKRKLRVVLNSQVTNEEGIFLSSSATSPRLPNLAYCFRELTNLQGLKSLYEAYYGEAAFIDTMERCRSSLESCVPGYEDIKSLLDHQNEEPYLKKLGGLIIAYGVYQVWQSWGIKPQFLIAQGWQGLYLALIADEVFTIETALNSFKTEDCNPPLMSSALRNVIPIILSETGEECKLDQIPKILVDLKTCVKTNPVPMESILNQHNIRILLNLSPQALGTFPVLSLELGSSEKNGSWLCIQALANLYANGYLINWSQIEAKRSYPFVDLPLYPWQHEVYWPKNMSTIERPLKEQVALPFPGRQLYSSQSEILFEFSIDSQQLPELADTNNGVHIGYYFEMFSFATYQITGQNTFTIKDLDFFMPLYVPQNTSIMVRLILSCSQHNNEASFKIFKHVNNETSESSAEGTLLWGLPLRPKVHSLRQLQHRCNRKSGNAQDFSRRIEAMSMPNGLSIRWTENYWLGEKDIIAKLRAPLLREYAEKFSLKVHPGLFDACIQPLFMFLDEQVVAPYITSKIDKLQYFGINNKESCEALFLIATLHKRKSDEKHILGDWYVVDKEETIIAFCEGIHLTQLSKQIVESIGSVQSTNSSLIHLERYPIGEQPKVLLNFLQEQAGEIFKMQASSVDPHQTLQDLGMDSLMAIDLRNRIEKSLGIQYDLKELILPIALEQIVTKILSKSNVSSLLEAAPNEASQSSIQLVDSNVWVAYRQKTRKAITSLRLFCFPYGGAGASIYRNWSHFLPKEIEVCPVQLPGRENRITEEPLNDLPRLIETLYHNLNKEMDIPYAFYGHSFGALIAFEFSRYLQEKAERLPEQLFLGGFPSAHLPNPNLQSLLKTLNSLPFNYFHPMKLNDDQLKQIIKIFNEWSLLEVGEKEQSIDLNFLRILLPTLLADLQLVANHDCKAKPLLSVPIIAFAGTRDTWVPPGRMKKWKDLTTCHFIMHEILGEHLFIKNEQQLKEVLKLIGADAAYS